MNDHVFHLRIVHSALGIGAPSLFRCGVIFKYANQINGLEIDEFVAARVFDPAAHNEVKLLHKVAVPLS